MVSVSELAGQPFDGSRPGRIVKYNFASQMFIVGGAVTNQNEWLQASRSFGSLLQPHP